MSICIAAAANRPGLARPQRQYRREFLGWMSFACIFTCFFRSAWFTPLFLVSRGVIKNYQPYTAATIVDQTNAVSTTAFDRHRRPCIDRLTGGHQDARHQRRRIIFACFAHPFENSTPLSNFIQMLSIFVIPAGLVTYYLGRMLRRHGHGWTVYACMMLLFLGGALVLLGAPETSGNPHIAALGVDPATEAG